MYRTDTGEEEESWTVVGEEERGECWRVSPGLLAPIRGLEEGGGSPPLFSWAGRMRDREDGRELAAESGRPCIV